MPCNSWNVVFALLTLISAVPIPVSFPSESISIVAFFSPPGTAPAVVKLSEESNLYCNCVVPSNCTAKSSLLNRKKSLKIP